MPLKDPEARREYHRQYMKRRYAEDADFRRSHKARTKKNSIVYKKRLRVIVGMFKRHGCLMCDEAEGCCMTAHHIDPAGKDFNIGDAVGRVYSATRLKEDLDKCVCLCHNCHNKVHAGIIELPV